MGKRRWPVRTISDILSNEKYVGDSFYGRTKGISFPSTQRIESNPADVARTKDHHPPIIDRELFDQVQHMKRKRSNIELDEQRNRRRKATRYS